MAIKKGLLRATFKVTGANVKYLPELMHKKGVWALEFSLVSNSQCLVTIDYKDFRKFFAICKNMCYNKVIINYKGIFAPATRIIKSAGLVIGAVLFTAITLVLSRFIFEIEVVGSGAVFERETLLFLETLGVKKYSPFNESEFSYIESEILKDNKRLSLVTLEKVGNRLIVNTVLSSSESQVIGEKSTGITASVSGVVEEISVLRGTALVEKGQSVTVGDALVGAYVTTKQGETYETYAVARVKIIATETYSYNYGGCEEDIKTAIQISKFLSRGEVVLQNHEIIGEEIIVTLKVRYVLYGG